MTPLPLKQLYPADTRPLVLPGATILDGPLELIDRLEAAAS